MSRPKSTLRDEARYFVYHAIEHGLEDGRHLSEGLDDCDLLRLEREIDRIQRQFYLGEARFARWFRKYSKRNNAKK